MKTFDDNASKKILTKQREKAQEAAKTKAALQNVHMVKYLAWEPELTKVGKPMKHPDGLMKGKYVVGYIDRKKQRHSTDVDTDWAKMNFGITALAYAQ